MSEQTRATLTRFGKSDKKSRNSSLKTVRLSFTLSDPNEDSCPVFDYGSVKSEEEKNIKKKEELHDEKRIKPNGILDPIDNPEEEEIKRIAAQLEEKYGDKKNKPKKGVRPKSKSYAELGAGYDETDPFIDNTEAYDEALEENQEAPYGGYYINSGPLELKLVQTSDQSDAEEFTKRRLKKGLPPVKEEEEDEEMADVEKTIDETQERLVNEGISEDNKQKLTNELEQTEEKHSPILNNSEEPVKKKKKRPIVDDVDSQGILNRVKKAKTVKTLLEEKRVKDVPPVVTDELKKQIASSTSICEAIESVVNAGNHDDNSNNSSIHSGFGSTSSTENSEEGKSGSQIIPPLLPDNLSPELSSLVEQIKNTAAVTDNTRNTFCQDINTALVKLEWKTREFSATNRNLLFAHLASYLPCTKDTLMRRAKKLFIHEEENRIDTVICKLKATIDATMPSLLEDYENECKKNEEKSITPSQNNGSQHLPDSGSTKLPKRKFSWTDETRGYLKEIVRLKNMCFKVLKPRKSTYEDYITTFLHTKIRILWPQGWMRTSTLQREINRSPTSGKSKHSSSHSPSKSDSAKPNVSASYSPANSQQSPSNGIPHPLYVSTTVSGDVSQQPQRSPHTPQLAKTTNPLNLLTKITSPGEASPSHQNKSPYSPALHQSTKMEKPETFSVDCLLKRTNEHSNCNDYNTTLSDILKQESVIRNGVSLPLTNLNTSETNNSSRSEKILDLSSCNSSVSGTPSVIHSVLTNERTALRASDSVSLNANISDGNRHQESSASFCRKEVSSDLPFSRKQRLLQHSVQSNQHLQNNCDSNVIKKSENRWSHSAHKNNTVAESMKSANVERRMSDETTTATDILSQIISEDLRTPTPVPTTTHYNKVSEEVMVETPQSNSTLWHDTMKGLKELNDFGRSGGSFDSKLDSKKTSYAGASWPKPTKPLDNVSKTSQYQNEFLKHLQNSQGSTIPSAVTTPYSRPSISPYENSPYLNEISKSAYNSSHLSNQSMSSLVASPGNKISQMNQGCIMKNLPNTGLSSGNSHRYITQMDYGSDDQHLMGLNHYGLATWPYSGNESQPQQ